VDEASLHRAGTALVAQLDGAAVLITRGREGMSLFSPHAEPVHIAAASNGTAALDATGAGDTVVATVALCLAAGADLVQAARLASVAASVVVGRFGTATLTLDELIAAL
jgi:bifunctional ADP-heptose synthase (sugar kinase/adenylyltransferase)